MKYKPRVPDSPIFLFLKEIIINVKANHFSVSDLVKKNSLIFITYIKKHIAVLGLIIIHP